MREMQTSLLPVGIVVPTMDNTFFSRLADCAERFLYSKGCMALIMSSDNHAGKEKNQLRTLAAMGVRGILCVSGLSELPEGLVPDNLPMIWIDRKPSAERVIPCVSNDDRAAMAVAVNCLIRTGCRHILLLPGYLAETRTSPRVTGYEEALKKKGLKFDPAYILHRAGRKPSETETEELVRKTMESGLPVDAIITSSDRAAFGAITALHQVGLYVPEDVKLVCFDNSPYSAMAAPAITSMDRQPRKLAETACTHLLSMLQGENVPEETIVPVSLIRRDSTR